MKKYTAENIKDALNKVGIRPGDVVNIHTSLLALGRFECPEKQDPVIETIEVLREYLGSDYTLIAPAFNFDFCKGAEFNRQKTPSKGMGVLSEEIRKLEDAHRSSHPMQSVTAIGRFAGDICGRDTPSAFAVGGSFHRMLELDAKLLLYGVSFQAASFVHYAEEREEVPYRYWKSFSSKYTDSGVTQEREYKMFVRDLDLNPQLNIRNLQQKMLDEGTLKGAKLGMGQILSSTYTDLYKAATEILRNDVFSLLSNKEEVLEKLQSGKSKGDFTR